MKIETIRIPIFKKYLKMRKYRGNLIYKEYVSECKMADKQFFLPENFREVIWWENLSNAKRKIVVKDIRKNEEDWLIKNQK